MNTRRTLALIYIISSSAMICHNTNSVSPSHDNTHTSNTQDKQNAPKECNINFSESTGNDQQAESEKHDMHSNAHDDTKEVNNMAAPQSNQTSYEHDKDEEEKQIIQHILHNFAHIAGNFFNIVASPNDPQNVGNSIAGMLNGMINIAVQAFKSGELNLDSDQEAIEQFTQNLTTKLKHEMSRLITIKARLNNYSS